MSNARKLRVFVRRLHEEEIERSELRTRRNSELLARTHEYNMKRLREAKLADEAAIKRIRAETEAMKVRNEKTLADAKLQRQRSDARLDRLLEEHNRRLEAASSDDRLLVRYVVRGAVVGLAFFGFAYILKSAMRSKE